MRGVCIVCDFEMRICAHKWKWRKNLVFSLCLQELSNTISNTSERQIDGLTSKKFMPALYTSTTTSLGPARGSGASEVRGMLEGCA